MGRSQETFNKKEVRKNKEKKRKEKEQKKQARKMSGKSGSLDDMIAYVDENGKIVSEPPDPNKRRQIVLDDIQVSVPKDDPSLRPDTRRTGKVTYFNSSKGYGFIRDLVTQENVFVHVNSLMDDVREGSMVTFEIGAGQKGPAAIGVRLAK